MCLAVPVFIKAINENDAEVDIGGITRRISIELTPEARVGDYAIVHSGYAINILDQKEAEETLRLLGEMIAISEVNEN
jgi:hydrogenase expression/formation protein HypC